MPKRRRDTSNGDIGRVIAGSVLIVTGLMTWGQNAADLSVHLIGMRGSLSAGFLVAVSLIGGLGLLLIGLFWRGSERRR